VIFQLMHNVFLHFNSLPIGSFRCILDQKISPVIPKNLAEYNFLYSARFYFCLKISLSRPLKTFIGRGFIERRECRKSWLDMIFYHQPGLKRVVFAKELLK